VNCGVPAGLGSTLLLKGHMTILGKVLEIRQSLHQLGDPEKARFLQRFFKTGPGQYAEGDRFIGVKVPQVRGLLRTYRDLLPQDVMPMLFSAIHEERLFALLALVRCFEKGDPAVREEIYGLYLANTRQINNWDLVDCSAPRIVGGYLMERDRKPLYRLLQSTSIWSAAFPLCRPSPSSVTASLPIRCGLSGCYSMTKRI
jgi:hypothetical protein